MKSSFIITPSEARACYEKTDSQVSTEQAPDRLTFSSFTRRLPFDPQKIILDRWNGPLDVAPPRKVHGENPREGEKDASFLADTTLKF